ncbi:MAG: 3-deoxy-D-manno-octulosonic acid transferase [Planctomycetes bacterium]|nr:3-deoxy-D-manno-octulosonic acid transferase [Planctomycetota bacterium]
MRGRKSAPELPRGRLGDPDPGPMRRVLYAVYDAGWVVAAIVGAPWLLWSCLRRPGFAAGVRERIGRGLDRLPPRVRSRVLVHGVSVGEVKAARSIVTELEKSYPELEVVISTTTDTGMEVARGIYPENLVVRFPVDLSFFVRRFLRCIDPTFVVLVELEIWPNFLRQCNRDGRPVAVVNGRITEISHGRYLVFRKLLPEFNRISLFCVQSPEYAERFRLLDVEDERILVTGNIKVDGLRTGPLDPGEERRELLGGRPGQRVLVAGSTHEPEERWLAQVWREFVPELRLILVPRHPSRSQAVLSTLAEIGVSCQSLSSLRAGNEEPDASRPALVDTIGELEWIYGLADLVFVGGTLAPHGGQNMLEPAAQGKVCVFGPHLRNFTQEAKLLLEAQAAVRVEGTAYLGPALVRLEADPAECARMGQRGMESVASQRGATAITTGALATLGFDRLQRTAFSPLDPPSEQR